MSKWKAQNTKAILASVRKIFKTGNIFELTPDAYKHITLHMGFIAHYNLAGFCCTYEDIELFRSSLKTSEYSNDPDYNRRLQNRYMVDPWFQEKYGTEYCQSVVDCNRGILDIAERVHIEQKRRS